MSTPALVRHVCPDCGEWVEALPSAQVGHYCPSLRAPRGRRLWVWFVAALVALLASCSGSSASVEPASVAAPVDSMATHHGAVNPNVTQDDIATTICHRGWTATIRPPVSYTDPIKRALWVQAGSKGKLSDYELDHVVPLEVGGAPRDPANLVLQPWNGPTGAHAKDAVENRVKAEVCAHTITLAAGEQCFLDDWRRCP